MQKLEIPHPNSTFFKKRKRLREKLRESIDSFKFIIAGAAFVALLSSTLVLLIHQNNQISGLKYQLQSGGVSLQDTAHHSRTKRSVEKEKSVQEHQHSVSKRNAGGQNRDRPPYSSVGGAVYIRWGRMDCPDRGPSDLIYSGMGAGALQGHTGGGGNLICLHRNTTYYDGEYRNGFSGASHLYGLEWRDSSWVNNLFDLEDTMGRSLQYHTLPCALCMASRRHGKVTIHGKRECPEGWIHEYDGYIMAAGHSDKHSTEYICVDRRPQVVPGTQGAQSASYLYMVETQCASLLCEPVVAGREIRCVVCTI